MIEHICSKALCNSPDKANLSARPSPQPQKYVLDRYPILNIISIFYYLEYPRCSLLLKYKRYKYYKIMVEKN